MASWPNLTDLLVARTDAAPVGLLGAPLGTGSVTPGACDRAPGMLRDILRRIGRYDVETGRELATRVADRGDVAITGLMSIEEATRTMLQVHQNGLAVCGVFTYEVAETKVSLVIDFARENQHPLQCTLEKA